jgi:hypothetical protein
MTFLFFGAKTLKTMLPTLPMLPPTFLVTLVMSVTLKQPKTLTKNKSTANIEPPRNIEGGCGNPFRQGDNTPQIKAVFLRPSFFVRAPNWWSVLIHIMMVLFGQSLGLVAPCRGITTPSNTVTNTVVSMRDGFTTLLRQGITA